MNNDNNNVLRTYVLLTINYLSGFCTVVLYILFYVQYNITLVLRMMMTTTMTMTMTMTMMIIIMMIRTTNVQCVRYGVDITEMMHLSKFSTIYVMIVL